MFIGAGRKFLSKMHTIDERKKYISFCFLDNSIFNTLVNNNRVTALSIKDTGIKRIAKSVGFSTVKALQILFKISIIINNLH